MMTLVRRRSVLPMVLALGLMVAACSAGDDGSADPDVAGPSPVTEAAIAATAAPITVAPTTTVVATTIATTATPTTTPSQTPPPVPGGGYEPVDAPVFPARSAPPPTGADWPDGAYYAVVRGAAADAPTPRIAVTMYQLLTGPDAIAAAQADGVGLDSDLYVPPEPAAERDIELVDGLAVSVARPDRPGVSYMVTGRELVRLVNGAAPAPDSPAGYGYVPFPYLIAVQGGLPTRIDQLWAP